MQNILTEIGQILVIQPTNILTKVLSVDGYSEDLEGETLDRFFTKEFRYSKNGIVWTEWANITTITNVVEKDVLLFQFKFTRSGSDSTGELVFNSLDLDITYYNCNSPLFQQSVFSQLLTCCCSGYSIEWCLNVLNKCFESGLVPVSFDRYIDVDQEVVNQDFIDFWKSICCFFSLFVGYMNVFVNYKDNYLLLQKFISQYIYICGDEQLLQLKELCRDRLKEIRKRGTDNIVYQPIKGGYNGELLRLICFELNDFIHCKLSDKKYTSWCIGNNSPLTRQVFNNNQFNLLDLNNYFIHGNTTIVDNTITMPQNSGIGVDLALNYFLGQAIIIDSSLDFCLSMNIKCSTIDNTLSVGILCFDELGVLIGCLDANQIGGFSSDYFVEESILPINEQFYKLNFNIYGSGSTGRATFGILDNIRNKRFRPECVKVIPFITVSNNSVAVWEITDLYFGLINSAYSRGFLMSRNMIEMILKNNSVGIKKRQIFNTINQELIPYNSTPTITFINV